MPKQRIEPILWLLFSAGGIVAALMIPVLLLLFGVLFPLELVAPPDHAHLLAVVRNPLTRLVLFGTCVLALFHWAHRFKYTLYDGLQLKGLHTAINTFSYGGALLGSAVAGYLLLLLPV